MVAHAGAISDDDSEPILGHWFEETLAPREHSPTPGGPQAKGPDTEAAEGKGPFYSLLLEGRALIPDKEEPHGVRTTSIADNHCFFGLLVHDALCFLVLFLPANGTL